MTNIITNTINGVYSPSSILGSDTTTSKTGEKNQEMEFMELLLAQIKNQNPMEPANDKDWMIQFAQITTVQELRKLTTAMDELKKSNSVSYAASLIGKKVVAGDNLEGIVESVDINGDEIMLIVNGNKIPLSSVTSIFQAAEDEAQNITQKTVQSLGENTNTVVKPVSEDIVAKDVPYFQESLND